MKKIIILAFMMYTALLNLGYLFLIQNNYVSSIFSKAISISILVILVVLGSFYTQKIIGLYNQKG